MKRTGIQRGLGVAGDADATRPGLNDCLDVVLRQTNALVDGVLDGLAISVDRQLTFTSGESAIKPMLKSGIAAMVGQRAQVRADFSRSLRKYMYHGDGRNVQGQISFGKLQFLEDEQLDESIELARAGQEVALAVDDVLPALDALISTLLGWVTVQPQLNPLRPEIFVRALRDTINAQIADMSVSSALLVPASGRMGTALNRIYRETTDWLRSHGVEAAGAITTPAAVAQIAAGRATPTGAVARTLVTLDRLRRLLSGELDDADGAPKQDFLYTVPASVETLQDMRQVEAMVQRLSKKAARAKANPDETGAFKLAGRMDGKQMGQAVGEEVTRMMLENLTQDDRLLPALRSQLDLLESPLMQLAQGDTRFFNDRQHPARQFLDETINRGLGFTSAKDEGFARFLKSVEGAVAALIESGSKQMPDFASELLKLQTKWAHDDKAVRQRREEIARMLQHAEQRNLLAERMSKDFGDRAGGMDVPSFVVDFVCGPWAQVCAESQLTCTDGTVDQQGYQAVVDELFWSVQPRVAKRNLQRLVELIPRLLARMREGLHLVEYPPERIKVFFDQLISLHEAALEGASYKTYATPAVALPRPAAAAPSDPDAPEEAQDSGPWIAGKEASKSGYLDEDSVMPLDLSQTPEVETQERDTEVIRSVELHPGTWVDLMLEGAWVRAQLTWASPHRTLFMFTSGAGMAHTMSKRTMERLQTKGLIRTVSAGHLVDHALDAVAQEALKNTLNRP